ncbi:MAG TPA: C2 family cysteine protease [Polyangiaceae bacterium]
MNVGQVGFRSWRSAQDEMGGADPAESDDPVCRDGRDILAPVLFRQEAGDKEAVDLGDVTQGHLDDCFFLAPLAAMAMTDQGRAFIRSSIADNYGPDGAVHSYTVTLRRPVPDSSPMSNEVKVVVSASDFGCNHARARVDEPTGDHEIWPLVYESAYLQVMGGVANVERNRGGDVASAMLALTGRVPTENRFKGSEGKIENALQGQELVVVGTESTAVAPLLPAHAYVVTSIDRSGHETRISLHNPHNKDGSNITMTYAQLSRYASSVFIGSLP